MWRFITGLSDASQMWYTSTPWQWWAGKKNPTLSDHFFPTWALGTRNKRVTLHCPCENCIQMLHRLKCTSKMASHTSWSFSTWAWHAAELKAEQSIFCSSLYTCKTSPSISSTHFSYRQELLCSFEHQHWLAWTHGWNGSSALLQDKPCVQILAHACMRGGEPPSSPCVTSFPKLVSQPFPPIHAPSLPQIPIPSIP